MTRARSYSQHGSDYLISRESSALNDNNMPTVFEEENLDIEENYEEPVLDLSQADNYSQFEPNKLIETEVPSSRRTQSGQDLLLVRPLRTSSNSASMRMQGPTIILDPFHGHFEHEHHEVSEEEIANSIQRRRISRATSDQSSSPVNVFPADD